jgi:hypothetical protein
MKEHLDEVVVDALGLRIVLARAAFGFQCCLFSVALDGGT